MRRTIAAVVAAVLLLAPGSALAECSWVLWQETIVPTPEFRFERTYSTKEECDLNQARLLLRYRSAYSAANNNPMNSESGLYIIRPQGAPDIVSRLICAPDTVDPRGPKGK